MESTSPESTHDLLLALAGRVDDDLLAWARELVAVGEDAHAVEMLTATLTADAVALPAAVRRRLVELARSARIELDAEATLAPSGADGTEHRFAADPAAAAPICDVLGTLPARQLQGCTVLLTQRRTPAGSAPGPLPQAVLLVEVEPGTRRPDMLSYQLAAALARSGVPAAVEVLTTGAAVPPYHAEALRSARPLRIDPTATVPEPAPEVEETARPPAAEATVAVPALPTRRPGRRGGYRPAGEQADPPGLARRNRTAGATQPIAAAAPFGESHSDTPLFESPALEGRAAEKRAADDRASDGRAGAGRSSGGRPSAFDSRSDRSSDGRSPDGRGLEGRTSDRRTLDSRTSESRFPDGRAAEGRAFDDRTAEGRAAEDRASDGRSFEGHSSGSHTADGRGSERHGSERHGSDSHGSDGHGSDGRSSESRSSGGPGSEDRSPEGRGSDGRVPDGRVVEGHVPDGRGPGEDAEEPVGTRSSGRLTAVPSLFDEPSPDGSATDFTADDFVSADLDGEDGEFNPDEFGRDRRRAGEPGSRRPAPRPKPRAAGVTPIDRSFLGGGANGGAANGGGPGTGPTPIPLLRRGTNGRRPPAAEHRTDEPDYDPLNDPLSRPLLDPLLDPTPPLTGPIGLVGSPPSRPGPGPGQADESWSGEWLAGGYTAPSEEPAEPARPLPPPRPIGRRSARHRYLRTPDEPPATAEPHHPGQHGPGSNGSNGSGPNGAGPHGSGPIPMSGGPASNGTGAHPSTGGIPLTGGTGPGRTGAHPAAPPTGGPGPSRTGAHPAAPATGGIPLPGGPGPSRTGAHPAVPPTGGPGTGAIPLPPAGGPAPLPPSAGQGSGPIPMPPGSGDQPGLTRPAIPLPGADRRDQPPESPRPEFDPSLGLRPESIARLGEADLDLLAKLQAELRGGQWGARAEDGHTNGHQANGHTNGHRNGHGPESGTATATDSGPHRSRPRRGPFVVGPAGPEQSPSPEDDGPPPAG